MCSGALTVLLEDEHHTGEDFHHLSHHHGWGGQVPRALGLQGAGVPHGEHQGGGLEHQHAQREVLQPGRGHGQRSVGGWRQRRGWEFDVNIRWRQVEVLLVGKHRQRQSCWGGLKEAKQVITHTTHTQVRGEVADRLSPFCRFFTGASTATSLT